MLTCDGTWRVGGADHSLSTDVVRPLRVYVLGFASRFLRNPTRAHTHKSHESPSDETINLQTCPRQLIVQELCESRGGRPGPVSYTHLTLPTTERV